MKYFLSFLVSFSLFICSAQVFDDLIPLDRPLHNLDDAIPLDIDNDGDMDFIFSQNEFLYWFENLGNDQISERQGPIYSAQGDIRYLFTNDLDQDGDQDLQLSIQSVGPVRSMDNLDEGLLGLPLELNIPFDVSDLILGDIKTDGSQDLISINSTGSAIYRSVGTTDGTFEPVEFIEGFSNQYNGVALKDLNDDGINDLVVNFYTPGNQGTFSWYPGENDGGFDDPIQIGTATSGYMNVTDIDLDGDYDILRAGPAGVEWFVNNGNGFLINITVHNLYNGTALSNGSLPHSDMDQDGDIDICLMANNTQFIWIENNGSTSNWPIHYINTLWPNSTFNQELSLSDVDGDGTSDIFTYNSTGFIGTRISYALNDGNGNLTDQWDVGFTALISGSKQQDVNGDGLVDLITADDSPFGGGAYLYLNAGNGAFKTQKTLFNTSSFADESSPKIRNISDIDADGDLDIVLGFDDGLIGWVENEGNDIFTYKGVMDAPIINSIHKTYFRDFNGDGLVDLLCDEVIDDDVSLYLGVEPGIYEFDQNLDQAFGEYERIYVADFDSDSDMDIIFYGTISSQSSALFLNDGMANFAINSEMVARNAWSLLIDMDDDGDLDALTTDKWFENDANHTFSQPHFMSNLVAISGSTKGIFDYDGDEDFDAILFDGRVQTNLGFNTYSDPIRIVENDLIDYYTTAVIDSDNDDDLDVILSTSDDTSVGEHRLYLAKYLGKGGCTNGSACNYDVDAYIDDGSCCFSNCGCTNSEAENYNNSVSCDDGSCEYQITGFVFTDSNSSGNLDVADKGLAFERVLLLPDSVIFTTDEYGQFHASFIGNQPRVLSVIRREERDRMTTNESYGINLNDPSWSNPIYEFGFLEIVFAEWKEHSLKGGIESPGRNYACDQSVIHEVFVTNDGNSILNATIDVTIGDGFIGYEEIDNLNSLTDNLFRFTVNYLEPGERAVFKVGLITPQENPEIEELQLNAVFKGYHQGVLEVTKTRSKTELLNCNPINNLIDADPRGFTSENYIAGDEHIRYNLDFQNNTASTFTEVIIDNQLSEYLMLKDLQLIDAPGLSYCTINIPERTMTCTKKNANLTPSSENYDNSNGHFVFEAKPESGLAPGTVINISNEILLDGFSESPGSYFHTIVDCNLFDLSINPSSLDLCIGEEVLVSATGDLFETLDWSFAGVSVGNENELIFNSMIPGMDTLILTNQNQICENTATIPVITTQTLFAEVDGDFDFCLGESTTINSTSTADLEWIFNNEIIGSGNTVTLDESGELQLQLSDGICFSTPLLIEINEVNFPSAPSISIISGQLFTNQLSDHEYQWFFEGELIPGATSNTFTPELAGSYSVQVTNSAGCSTLSFESILVGLGDEIVTDKFGLYPNPMSDNATLELGLINDVSIIYISDTNGKIIRIYALDKNASTHIISRGGLKAGSYVLRFIHYGQVYSTQFIIL